MRAPQCLAQAELAPVGRACEWGAGERRIASLRPASRDLFEAQHNRQPRTAAILKTSCHSGAARAGTSSGSGSASRSVGRFG